MACTSKSPARVLRVAYQIAQRSLPAYSHPCSPKKFTQHQLFACLVLKEFFRLDYRGVEALLAEGESLRATIELRSTPDFTTLQKACAAAATIGLQSAARPDHPAGASHAAVAHADRLGRHRFQRI